MNRHRLIALFMFFAVTCMAVGQTEMDSKDKPKPRRKDQSHFTLKAYYYSPNLKLKNNIVRDLDVGTISGIASHTTLGFSLYIPLGKTFFIQPEALFSLTTDWVAASHESGVWREFKYAFSHRTGTAMDVPLLVGVKWAPSKLFRAKAYLGPTFNLGWREKEFQSVFNPYVLTLGVGLDLLNFLALDMGYMMWMDGMAYTNFSRWFMAVGIVM